MKLTTLTGWATVLIVCALLACPASATDTDGDGLLDLIDAPGFDPNSTGRLILNNRGIEDLDGANLLTNLEELWLYNNQLTSLEMGDFDGLTNLQVLLLRNNRISSLENGDFDGLTNLRFLQVETNQLTRLDSGVFHGLNSLEQLRLDSNEIFSLERGAFDGLFHLHTLWLNRNQITSLPEGIFDDLTNLRSLNLRSNQITSLPEGVFDDLINLGSLNLRSNLITSLENGAFKGLDGLATLILFGNDLSELNLTEATFQNLSPCGTGPFFTLKGFCGPSGDSLVMDQAVLSTGSFDVIVGEMADLVSVSLVGLTFSDKYPSDLSQLLSISTLDNVTVDHALFDIYADELNAFAVMDGNSLTVVPEPSTALMLALAAGIASICLLRDRRKLSDDNGKEHYRPETLLPVRGREITVLIVVCLLSHRVAAFNVIDVPAVSTTVPEPTTGIMLPIGMATRLIDRRTLFSNLNSV